MSTPYTVPTAAELLTAVREFLRDEVVPAADAAVSFHARVAVGVLATVERELDLGDDARARFDAALRALGVADERELAEQIREGRRDAADPDLLDRLGEITRDRLRVSNPGHLAPVTDDDPRRPAAEEIP